MSGKGDKAPTKKAKTAKVADAREAGPPEEAASQMAAAKGLGSPAPPAAAKQFFLLEYVSEVVRGIKWLRKAPKPEEPTLRRVQRGFFRWSRGRKSRIGVFVVFGIVAVTFLLFSMQAASTPLLAGPGIPGGGGGPGENTGTMAFSGSVPENARSDTIIDIENTTSFAGLTVTLSWTDEGASNPTVRNTPDNLGLNITAPDGDSWELAPVSNGRLVWSLNETGEDMGGNEWKITVIGGTMGDEVPITGRPGPCLRCLSDGSNNWDITVDYSW